jgi:hypothetical protein
VASTFGDIENALEQESRLAKVAIEDSLTTSLAQQSTTFTFALATPHAVIDVIVESVNETLTSYGARRADSLGEDDARPVAREEGFWSVLTALSVGHPFGTHNHLPSHFYSHSSHIGRNPSLQPLQLIYNSVTNVLD